MHHKSVRDWSIHSSNPPGRAWVTSGAVSVLTPPNYVWYSFCSIHQLKKPECLMCQSGTWIDENDPEVIADRQLFKDNPKAWRKKHNA